MLNLESNRPCFFIFLLLFSGKNCITNPLVRMWKCRLFFMSPCSCQKLQVASDCVQVSAIMQLTDKEEHGLSAAETRSFPSYLILVMETNLFYFIFPVFCLSLHAHTHTHRWVISSPTALLSIHPYAAITLRKTVPPVLFLLHVVNTSCCLKKQKKTKNIKLFFDLDFLHLNRMNSPHTVCLISSGMSLGSYFSDDKERTHLAQFFVFSLFNSKHSWEQRGGLLCVAKVRICIVSSSVSFAWSRNRKLGFSFCDFKRC